MTTYVLDTTRLKTCQTDVGFKHQAFLSKDRCSNHSAVLLHLANLDACCNFSSLVHFSTLSYIFLAKDENITVAYL